jgi:hypothetical protein
VNVGQLHLRELIEMDRAGTGFNRQAHSSPRPASPLPLYSSKPTVQTFVQFTHSGGFRD